MALLKHQKRFVGLIAGLKRRYHSDPLFARYGLLKIEDLYRHQLRVHAWRFWHGYLPTAQSDMLNRVSVIHGHSTRGAANGIYASSRDHCSLNYRLPNEWASMERGFREEGSLMAFKRRSKREFVAGYKAFKCLEVGCRVCGDGGI